MNSVVHAALVAEMLYSEYTNLLALVYTANMLRLPLVDESSAMAIYECPKCTKARWIYICPRSESSVLCH